MTSRPSLRTIALSLTALLVPLSMLAANLVAALYKSNNPDSVDITNGLAYLQQSLVAGFGTAVMIAALIIWLITRMYRRDKSFAEAKLPLVLLVSIGVLVTTLALISNYTSTVEDQYRKDHGQPTLSEFFDRLDKQKPSNQ